MKKSRKIVLFFTEFLGTALLVCLGCLGALKIPALTYLFPCLTFGLVVMALIQALGAISGCHINPAITLSALINGSIGFWMAALYIIAQILGGYFGFGLLVFMIPPIIVHPPGASQGACSSIPHPEITPIQAFFIEFVATGLLISVISGISHPRNAHNQDIASVKIGLTVAVLTLATRFTGTGMNPARSLGPAAWNGDWDSHWVYWTGPLLGSIFATFFYKYFFWRPAESDLKEIGGIERMTSVIDTGGLNSRF